MSIIPEQAEKDAIDAAYRLATRQFVKLTREPLVAFLSKQLSPDAPESVSNKIASFLDTELGEALIAGMLGAGITLLPKGLGEHVPRIAKELRVKAMADSMDVVMDIVMAPLRSVIGDLITRVPDPIHALPVQAQGQEKVSIEIDINEQGVGVGNSSGSKIGGMP